MKTDCANANLLDVIRENYRKSKILINGMLDGNISRRGEPESLARYLVRFGNTGPGIKVEGRNIQ